MNIEGIVSQVDSVLSKALTIDGVKIAFEDICDIQCACDSWDAP